MTDWYNYLYVAAKICFLNLTLRATCFARPRPSSGMRSHKLQSVLTHDHLGFQLWTSVPEDCRGRPKHVARSVIFKRVRINARVII